MVLKTLPKLLQRYPKNTPKKNKYDFEIRNKNGILKMRFITPIDFSKLNFFIMTVGSTEPTIAPNESNPIIIPAK